MKRQKDNSAQDQNATKDDNFLMPVFSDEEIEKEIEKEMIKKGYYQHFGEFEEEVWDEGRLYWARKCFAEGFKCALNNKLKTK